MSNIEDAPIFDFEYTPTIPEGIGKTDISYGLSNKELLIKMLPFRADFVKKMGWLTGKDLDNDIDIYDHLPSTLHFSLTDREADHIIAGLRLTNVPSVEKSLSWKMFSGNNEMRSQAYNARDNEGRSILGELSELGQSGHLWDLTRLVNDIGEDVDHEKIAAAMMELFGAGYGVIRNQTPEQEWKDVRWVFNGTALIKYALDALGVQHTVLAEGMINEHDVAKSYFCMVKAEEATQYIYAHAHEKNFRFPHEHLDDGLRKANAL